jgi:hypothetical protein
VPLAVRLQAQKCLAFAGAAAATLGLAAPATAAPRDETARASQGAPTRYSIVHGCYALRPSGHGLVAKAGGGYSASAGSVGEAEPFRMQATELGQYLFYGRNRDYLAGDSQNRVVTASGASPSTDWRVDEAGSGRFKIVLPSANKALGVGGGGELVLVDPGAAGIFSFEQAQGCPAFPEVEVSASGKPLTAPLDYGEVQGMIDLHQHMMAFEFLGGSVHCGRPWHRYGVEHALRDCDDHSVANGCGAVLENVLYGSPARCHDPGGWPTFAGWPHPKSLTHEQTYYKWLERAWMGGLRAMVNLFVENRVLCELYPLKRNSCDEMTSVRLQARQIRALENYIDAQSGGPGKGWFRIVSDPFEARRTIAAGKLAVIPGIEVSEPFGCQIYNEQPKCDRARIDRELNEVYGFGVRQMELINKFDNALAGVAGDSNETGVVVNSGNKYATGQYWQMTACDGPKDEEDKTQLGVYEHDENDLGSNLIESFVPMGAAPIYPQGSSCNARGLTGLGEYAVRRLMEKGMIVDPDHLSVRARKGVMSLLEAERYSGAVSSHSWSTPDVESRIYTLGGVITPMQDRADDWVKHWRETRAKRNPRFYFGYGYGADQNGFATQFGPRNGPNPVTYPFKSFDGGVTLNRQRSGSKEFDLNREGMAHYGLFPDWWQDIKNMGGQQALDDMARGAESYLQMWERSVGIPGPRCRFVRGHFKRRGLAWLRLNDSHRTILRRAGQPQHRTRTWRFCVRAHKNPPGEVAAVMTKKEKVGLVISTARGHEARHISTGARARKLRRQARRIGKGLYVRRIKGGRRYFYGVRKGRVRYVGIALPSVAKKRSTLRRYVKLAGVR